MPRLATWAYHQKLTVMAVLVHAVIDHGDKEKELRGMMAALAAIVGKGRTGRHLRLQPGLASGCGR